MTSLLGAAVRPTTGARDFGLRHVAVLVAALMVAAGFATFGLTGHAAVMTLFLVVLVVLSVIDIEQRILPNRIVLPAACVALAANIALAPERAGEWVAAGILAALFLLVAHVLYPAGMGMGDVKLALLLGVALGFSVSVALVVGILAAVPLAVFLLAREGRAARKTTFAFGPFLATGAVVAVFFGQQLLSVYLSSGVG